MNKQLNALIVAIVCLLILPVVTFAQLPTPTYGWNMGNTLEPPCGEGCWGGPGSQALINAVADAGFNAVRIPCAWTSNSDSQGQINATYMARVTQYVNWCLARNLYVIINSHWDGGWFDSCGFASFDSNINNKVQSIWTQIATNFINHDNERLWFSCSNEPDIDSQAKTDVLLQYYQTFVNAVRATGGQNTNRWLVLSGPSTASDKTYNWFNTLPSDSATGRLAVEVHDYTPYQYTLMTSDQSWGNRYYFWGQGYHHPTRLDRNPTWGEEDYIQTEHQKMKTKFIDNGIPVILGEFHATKRTNYTDLTGWDHDLHIASRTYYHKTVQNIANSKGLKPFYWDTPGGFFEWTTGTVLDSANINALTGGAALPPPGGDTTPPSAPTGLSAILSIINTNLNWNDNTETDLAGYNIYRSTTSGGGYTKLNGSLIVDSQYTDYSTISGQTCYYVVKAVDTSWNESGASSEQSVLIPKTALGSILREWWTGISGSAVSNLTSNANYPNNPTGREQITSLEGPINWADNYGTRIRGYLYPPTTGSYTFWIAGDDNCQLKLSTDGSPSHATIIAQITSWTNSRVWTTYSSQQSTPRTLTAGQKYYIEVLHKEYTGGDNIAIAWQGPGIAQDVIPGGCLSPWFVGLYGDFDDSGTVSTDDLAELAAVWLQNDCAATSQMDLDGDCVVDFYEFSQFAQNWMN